MYHIQNLEVTSFLEKLLDLIFHMQEVAQNRSLSKQTFKVSVPDILFFCFILLLSRVIFLRLSKPWLNQEICLHNNAVQCRTFCINPKVCIYFSICTFTNLPFQNPQVCHHRLRKVSVFIYVKKGSC